MWEKRFPNICKDFLNNPVLSLEPNSIKFPKSSIGFLLWLSFLPLCGGLNHFHDDTLTRAGNLFLRVRNILFQVQNTLNIWSKNTLQIKKIFFVRRGRDDFLGIRLVNENGQVQCQIGRSFEQHIKWKVSLSMSRRLD